MRLQQQIGSASGKVEQLSTELSRLQLDVRKRREERAKNAPKNVEELREELAKLNKDLEVSRYLLKYPLITFYTR